MAVESTSIPPHIQGTVTNVSTNTLTIQTVDSQTLTLTHPDGHYIKVGDAVVVSIRRV